MSLIHSKPNTPEWEQNYDGIFRPCKKVEKGGEHGTELETETAVE